MRILFILEYFHPHVGGVETFFKTLSERLAHEGHEVTVLTNKYKKELVSEEQGHDHIRIVRKNFYNRYGFTFLSWISAIKMAREVDLIHTTSYNAAIPAWIAATFTGKKAIITFHERWGKLWFKLPWMSRFSQMLHFSFEKMVTRLGFDQFIGVSDYTVRELNLAGLSSDRVKRIYNGIEYGDFPYHLGSGEDQPFTFLYFGRVGVAKGLDILIAGYELLCQESRNHQLILVLPNDDKGPLMRIKGLVEQKNLQDQIILKHDLPFTELKAQISVADAVVVPSYSEGFCFAAVETQAIGTPIISSGRGALVETVGGIHITVSEHTPESWKEALRNGIEGKWTRSPVKKFLLSDTIDQYLKVYDQLMKS